MMKLKAIQDFVRNFVKDFIEEWNTEESIDAFTYLENLYCPNCGEDEELEQLGSNTKFDEYQCEACNEIFQVPSINK